MSKRYTYSRSFTSIEGTETFTAVEFDAFDEAVRVVDKGIYERKLDLDKRYPIRVSRPLTNDPKLVPLKDVPETKMASSNELEKQNNNQ